MRTKARLRPLVESLESRRVLSTYYVSSTGNNAANGSATAPWQTLQHAADVVKAGDLVDVRAGNYAGFDLGTSGTAAARITFQAEPGAIINQRNARTPDGINLEGASYVTIQGFKVVGMPRAGIRSVVNTNVTIRNNTTDQNAVWGIFTGFSDNLTIENNVASRSQAQHGIYVSNSGDNPVIRGNDVWGNHDSGIHMNGDASQGGDGIITGALVERNIIHDNGAGGGSAINADGVQNSRFQDNLLYNNHASGISLFRIDGGGGSTGDVVANNTIVMASDARWALNIQDASSGANVVNNILYNNSGYRGSIDISPDSLPGFTSNNNATMDRFTTDGGSSVMTLAQWRTATGQDAKSFTATPASLFVNAAGNDYHLSATSPAIDKGTSTLAPAYDLEGKPRPSGTTWDVGAYESQAAVVKPNRPPVALTDAATTVQSTPVAIRVLLNDSDPDRDPLKVVSATGPAHGTVVINQDGTITYTAAAQFLGRDTFTYTISDGRGGTSTATVLVVVKRS